MYKKDRGNKRRLAVWRLFLGGFLLGVVVPNILWKTQWLQKTSMSMYLLAEFMGSEIPEKEYFFEVLRSRSVYFLLAFLCGLSVFGVPFAIFGIIFCGIKIGILLSVSILQFGLAGGAVGAGLLFPQYFIYIPVLAYMSSLMYEQSMEVWKNRGLFPLKIYKYCIKASIAASIYIVGIIFEVFMNPWIVENLLKKLIIL